MAFCKFSSEISQDGVTVVNNTFFEQFLPFATGTQIKVYLYGLYLCSNQDSLKSNLSNLQTFADNLSLSCDEVMNAFGFWQEQGLVQIIETTPPQIQYMPAKLAIPKKKISSNKYEQFNLQVQSVISGRMINPNEYNEYHLLLETLNMSKEALLMIIQYCVELKGNKVLYPYIITIAKQWAYEGILTLEQVEERLKEYNETDDSLRKILKAMGISKNASLEEREMFLKWTKKFEFSFDVILFVAKMLKKGGFTKLDGKLTKYYEQRLMSQKEIEDYENNKDTLFGIAKEINKTLGVYYENLENIVDTYISPWLNRGYNLDTLKIIANYCFKNSIRNLEGMNTVVQKFYKMGLTSVESLAQFVARSKMQDEQIRKILDKANLIRNVTSLDREFYQTWVYSWNMPQDVIEYASTLSAKSAQPMQYINKILANWFEKKISNLEDARLASDLFKVGAGIEGTEDKTVYHGRTYSKEELDSLICDIDEIEI